MLLPYVAEAPNILLVCYGNEYCQGFSLLHPKPEERWSYQATVAYV